MKYIDKMHKNRFDKDFLENLSIKDVVQKKMPMMKLFQLMMELDNMDACFQLDIDKEL